jgi:enterochelin esterase-like enzyme
VGVAATLSVIAATFGWLGIRLPPPPGDQAWVVIAGANAIHQNVRTRAAWQPSPAPANTSGAVLGPVGPAATPAAPARPVHSPTSHAAAPPEPRPTVTAAPPPLVTGALPGQTQLLPPAALEQGHDWLEGVFGDQRPPAAGQWRQVSFYSRGLGRDVEYLAWVPPDYAATSGVYPTLYLLHGAGSWASHGVQEWLGYALTEDLERLLALGLIRPMIVVLPDGEQGYWMNHASAGPRWGDFVALDLVRHVDATFRTDPRPERRAIGGLSMGGHGALQLALNHPETFSIAGGHSPTLRPFEESPTFFGDEQEFALSDPLTLVRRYDAARRILVWIDVGEEDRWRREAERLALALAERHAPYSYTVLPGEHEGWYWREYLPVYLRFYSAALATR